MKKSMKVLCMLLLVVMCIMAELYDNFVGFELPNLGWGFVAEAFEEGDFCYEHRLDAEGVRITRYNKSESDAVGTLIIPSTLRDYPVTAIGEDLLRNRTGLTKVIIPNSVTSIGGSAFFGCTNLTSVTIGNSVTSIGSCAFYGCTSLTSVTIPDSVTSIGRYAFDGCTSLTSITIPNSVTNIGEAAFGDCTSLTSITVSSGNTVYHSTDNCIIETATKELVSGCNTSVIPNDGSVTSIGVEAFRGFTSLTDVTIPYSVTSIGDWAFSGCTGLTDVTIPDSVTSIGDTAFCECTGLKSITIGNSVTKIGSWAFRDCTGLRKINWNAESVSIGHYGEIFENAGTAEDGIDVVFGNRVKKIPESLFSGTETKIKTVTIGNNVTSIERLAFAYCVDLTAVTIGSSVMNIGDMAFIGCTGLKKIKWNAESAGDFIEKNYVFHDCGTSGDGIEVVFGDNVKTVPAYLFYSDSNCGPNITTITIGRSITNIGSKAFYRCSNLTKINWNAESAEDFTCSVFTGGKVVDVIFGDNVKTIPAYLFYGRSVIKSVTFGNSVTDIGDSAFYNCSGLTSITIPNSVTNIGDSAFYSCSGLTSITIPNSVTNIGDSAFYSCSGLTSITIPNSVTSIGDSTFYNCTSLTDVVIGNGVTNIGSNAFFYCTELTSVTIPNSVTNIGDDAFYRCTSLTDVIIGNSVTSIGSSAFSVCDGLTSITIPDSVTSIGDSAFYWCSGLTDVTIGNSVTSIGSRAFYLCDGLISVTIGNSVTDIGTSAFYGCDNLADVYYNGTKEDWNTICIDDCNDPLLNATIHFISDDPSHTHTPKTITISASCTVDGMTYQVCSECGEPIGTPTVIPAAHTPGDWEVDIEPTYEAEGKEVIKCTVCHKILESKPIPKLVKPVITDEDTGIKVEYNDSSYDGSVDMTVTETFDGSAYQLIDTIGATSSKIYDITITVDGEETQPNGKVTVKIPLPAGYNPDHSYVYHVNTETGAVEKMPARYEDGYMVFETDHFSYYAVIEIHEHTFSDSKCTVCGYDRSDSCSCNCHASGIAHFFFVIVNFFQKLFGNNKVCACGAKH